METNTPTSSPPEATAKPKPKIPRIIRIRVETALFLAITPCVLVMTLWATLALNFSNIPGEWFRMILAGAFALGTVGAFTLVRNRLRTLLWWLAVFGVIVIYWILIPASNDRDWTIDVAKEPHAKIDGDNVTIYGIRNFDYRHDPKAKLTFVQIPRYYDHTYDLNDLETVDFVLSSWGVKDVVHTLFTFRFKNAANVVLSVETRREKGQPQTAIRGLYKQYEIIYILGTEEDILRLRTNFRDPREQVYLYPTNATKKQTRDLFLDILKTVNRLKTHPTFYNTICDNCTTGLVPHLRHIGLHLPFDMRLILNGLTDQLALQAGWIASDLPYSELRQHFHVNPYVQDLKDPKDYSEAVRGALKKK